MLTKNQSKRILSLSKKKHRTQEQLFVAEGVKVVKEFLDSNYELVEIFSTDLKYSEFTDAFIHISDKELSKIPISLSPLIKIVPKGFTKSVIKAGPHSILLIIRATITPKAIPINMRQCSAIDFMSLYFSGSVH